MNLRYYTLIGSLAAIVGGGAILAPPIARAAEEGVEVLTRGPVHEAFAESVNVNPEPGMIVSTEPPTLIEEVPPDQRPDGDNVAWIPGYWGWDEESTDFIWISGVWRNLPPGRQWVPGYWGEDGNQWQWTSGYWADEAKQEVTYLSKPPQSLESGPSAEAPSKNHIWISGSWINREDRYAWRPGYWEMGQQNWAWTPAHYQYTPRGYVFIEGYWDYDVPRRGVVFAPVRFSHDYYERPNYSYTPLVVIALNVFADHLFVRPRYGHYYYGDYYEPRYQQEGFFASFSYRTSRGGYDPLYAQNRWHHRNDQGWEEQRRESYDYYRDNQDARPPRTWAALQARPDDKRTEQRDNYQFAQPLQKYVTNTKDQRFEKVSMENRIKIVEKNKQVQKFSQERRKMENRPDDKASESSDKRIQMKQEKIAQSPLAGKSIEKFSKKNGPPKVPVSKAINPSEAKNLKDRKGGDPVLPGDANAANNKGKKGGDTMKKFDPQGKQSPDGKGEPNMPMEKNQKNGKDLPTEMKSGPPSKEPNVGKSKGHNLQSRAVNDSPSATQPDPKLKDSNIDGAKSPKPKDLKEKFKSPKNEQLTPDIKVNPTKENRPQPRVEQTGKPRKAIMPEPARKTLAPLQERKAESRPQPVPAQPKQQKAQPEPRQQLAPAQPKQQRAQPEPRQQQAPAQPEPRQQPAPQSAKPEKSSKKGKGDDSDPKKN